MRPEKFRMDDFNAYLQNAEKQLDYVSAQHVVMGNESADLDSIVSAAVYAYFIHYRFGGKSANIVPMVNIESCEISLRPECIFHFASSGADVHHLVFSDRIELDRLHSEGRLKLTLVDHNALAPSQAHLEDAVSEIIDHHCDEKRFQGIERRVIEPVGSCATLVAEMILDEAPELLDTRLARLLLGPILLDTVNLDPTKKRCSGKRPYRCKAAFGPGVRFSKGALRCPDGEKNGYFEFFDSRSHDA